MSVRLSYAYVTMKSSFLRHIPGGGDLLINGMLATCNLPLLGFADATPLTGFRRPDYKWSVSWDTLGKLSALPESGAESPKARKARSLLIVENALALSQGKGERR